jgi:hypothetical protein
MDPEERRQRRDEARRRLAKQRRIAAAIGVLLLAAVLAVSGSAFLGGGGTGGDEGEAKAEKPPELPRGGRQILPKNLVVAFYGAPQDAELGALGIGTPRQAGRRLERQARAYKSRGRPVLPAFELISTIASNAPGPDNDWADRQSARTIERYLKAARAQKALLILDIQPGQARFMNEVRALRRFLVEPDVSLALDPEWSMEEGEVPGQTIGSTDAATVNQVSDYLADIVRRGRLPQKLLVIHRFTHDMIENEKQLKKNPGVALAINVDGFGGQEIKIAKYKDFTKARRRDLNGYKLFYKEDTNLMSPKQVLRMKPPPDLVVYE